MSKADKTVRERMLDDLARSGLDEKDAKRMKLVPLEPEETGELTGRSVPAYQIPYYDVTGMLIEFCRVRYLALVIDKETGKEIRYWQPPDSVPTAYFPPGVDWAAVSVDETQEVGITEGEKKAIKACKAGLRMIGLGGVWNHTSKDARIRFLDELADFVWKERTAEIVFDGGDLKLKDEVRRAHRRLTESLESHGAHVINVTLPGRAKLDDYLVDHDIEEYRALPREYVSGFAPLKVATYGAEFDPASIKRREWVITGRYARGEGTAIVGPPGTNKSMLLLTDAVQIATGRALIPTDKVTRGGVLLLVGEDSRRDVEARIGAICAQYKVSPAELGGRLHVVYQTEIDPLRYTLAYMDKDAAMLNKRMFAWMESLPDIAITFVDPLAAWNNVAENSNDALRVLCLGLRNHAASTNRAVVFDHHVNKLAMENPESHVGNLAAVRGGTHIVADMRWGFTMAKIGQTTATMYNIPEEDRRFYRRLDSLKMSHGAGSDEPTLFRVESVPIPNGESVGVLVYRDASTLREQGAKRVEAEKENFGQNLAAQLAQMLDTDGPCSIRDAATWLCIHASGLYCNTATGEPLADESIRKKLTRDVGKGIIEPKAQRRIAIEKKDGKHTIVFAAPSTGKRPKKGAWVG